MRPPMLARTFSRTAVRNSVKGWLMSEKCDGVRALWDGTRFMSREGNELRVPAEIIATMPAGVELDGELWAGRCGLQRMVSLLRAAEQDVARWSGVAFMVFDAPDARGGFEQRLAVAEDRVSGCAFARVIPQFSVRDHRHMRLYLKEVLKGGGEGLVLRQTGSAYFSGRSKSMLKVKPVYTAEAMVSAHDAGVLVLRWGAVVFRLCAGIGSAALPPVGAMITFSHLGLTDGGVPRSAAFLEVRDYE